MQWVDFKIGPRGGAKTRMPLDGRTYVLEVHWNHIELVWRLTISDSKGEVLRAGIWLRNGEDVLEAAGDSRLPPGKLRVWDTTQTGLDPGRYDLRRGASVRLAYIPAAEVS